MSRTPKLRCGGSRLLGEQDAAGAGAEGGLGADEALEDVEEAGALEELEEGGGLAAGHDEAVETGEFVGLADEMRGGAELGEAFGVDVEGALEGEDADVWGGSSLTS